MGVVLPTTYVDWILSKLFSTLTCFYYKLGLESLLLLALSLPCENTAYLIPKALMSP